MSAISNPAAIRTGSWDAGYSYNAHDIVLGSDGLLYSAARANAGFDPVADGGTHWNAVLATAWSASLSFATGQRTVGSDANTYRAIATASGFDPTADNGTHWQLETVTSSVSLAVPSRFPSFAAAWSFLTAARIAAGVTVTIQFADGTYNMGPTPYVLNHPFGTRLRIVGNTTTPTNCVLSFTGLSGHTSGTYYQNNWGAFSVHSGHTLGYLDGFRLAGPGVGSYGVAGLLAFDGATIVCGPHLVVEDFYAGVASVNRSAVDCDFITVRRGGDGNLIAYNGSVISAQGCLSEGASTWFAQSGLLAEFNSSIFAPNSTIRNNGGTQVQLNWGSAVNLDGATLSATTLTPSIAASGINGIQDIGTTYTNVGTPAARLLTSGDFVRFGMSPPYPFSTFGTYQFIRGGGLLSTISITQNGIATSFWGYAAGSNVCVLTTDGPELDLKVSGSNALDGTTGLRLTGTGVAIMAPASAPAGTVNGTVSFYLDEGGNNLKAKVIYSNGTVKTATVALT